MRRVPGPRRCAPVGAWLACIATLSAAFAAQPDYDLRAVELGGGCYVVYGSEEYFHPDNGGNIANTGFVVTDGGVVVIDSGPSLRYGRALRRAIDAVTGGAPVERVIITHGHPDHYLGNQAFAGVPIHAGAGTIELIRGSGEDFTVNLYRLVGDWMRGTESTPPDVVAEPGAFRVGDHEFELLGLAGHTADDWLLLDRTCGVLYAGDLVFNRRTLAVPHADLGRWRQSLEKIQSLPFDYLVPGHGEAVADATPVAQTADYLAWLERRLRRAFDAGLDITEVMELPIPERFGDFSLARDEYRRSVHTLFPALEASALPAARQ